VETRTTASGFILEILVEKMGSVCCRRFKFICKWRSRGYCCWINMYCVWSCLCNRSSSWMCSCSNFSLN
jgi:hypothetical protein